MVVALLSSLLSIPQGLDAAQRKAGNDASAMVPENGVHKVPLLKLDQTMRRDPGSRPCVCRTFSVPCRSSFAEADTKPC